MQVDGITDLTALLPSELPSEAATPAVAHDGSMAQPATNGGVSFGDIFLKTVDEANRADRAAASKIEALASGASDDLHGTMIAAREADISIKLVGTIRNKLLDAFQEIWKTSV